jgi:hypothetical protein
MQFQTPRVRDNETVRFQTPKVTPTMKALSVALVARVAAPGGLGRRRRSTPWRVSLRWRSSQRRGRRACSSGVVLTYAVLHDPSDVVIQDVLDVRASC